MKRDCQHLEVLERLALQERFWKQRCIYLLVEHLISEDSLSHSDAALTTIASLEAQAADTVVFDGIDCDCARNSLFKIVASENLNKLTSSDRLCIFLRLLSMRQLLLRQKLNIAEVAKHIFDLC